MLQWYSMAREPIHGSRYTYVKLKCRCDLCKEANAQYKRDKTAYYASLQASYSGEGASANAQGVLDRITHGLPSSYDWYQCRCYACTKAYEEAVALRKFLRLIKV